MNKPIAPSEVGTIRSWTIALSTVAVLGLFAFSARPPPGASPAALAPAPVAAPVVQFSANYPAALLYVLDAAADPLLFGQHRAEEYVTWIVDHGQRPPWLEAYASHRRAWNEPHRSGRDGSVSEFE